MLPSVPRDVRKRRLIAVKVVFIRFIWLEAIILSGRRNIRHTVYNSLLRRYTTKKLPNRIFNFRTKIGSILSCCSFFDVRQSCLAFSLVTAGANLAHAKSKIEWVPTQALIITDLSRLLLTHTGTFCLV